MADSKDEAHWQPGEFSAAQAFPGVGRQLLFLEDLMASFQKVLVRTELGDDDPQIAQQQGIVWMYSLKALKTGWAAARLIEEGCPEDANTLVRSLVETVANTCWLCRQNAAGELYAALGTAIAFRRLGALKNLRDGGRWDCPVPFDDTEYDCVRIQYETLVRKDRMLEKRWRGVSLRDRMKDVGMSNVYEQEYELLSSDAHADASITGKYFKQDGENVYPFPLPSLEVLAFPLHVVVIFLLKQMRVFAVITDAQESLVDELEQRAKRICELAPRPKAE